MPIKYKFVEKAKPGTKKNTSELNFHAPITVYTETIDPDSFLLKLHEQSNITKADIIRCLYSVQQLLIEQLKNGNIVQTGIIGTFAPIIKMSKGEVKNDSVDITISYRPDKEMKNELKKAKLKKINPRRN